MKTRLLVVVPTLNTGKQLKRLVESLKAQRSNEWRLLIVDGGSKKEELLYIKNLAATHENIYYENSNPVLKGWLI